MKWSEGLTQEDTEIIAARGAQKFADVLVMLRGDEYDRRLMRNAALASHPSNRQRLAFLSGIK
jgi:hypothetical protein